MITTIAHLESRRLLRNMQTWVMVAIMAALFGYLFLKQLESFLVVQETLAAQDHPIGLSGFMSVRYLEPLCLAFTLVAPLFAMRSFSEEYRQQTFALWQSSPVSASALVTGKFLGVFTVLLMLIVLACAMLFIMKFYVAIDIPLMLSATLGLILCTATCTACGIYFSTLTHNSLIAIVASLALLLFSWLLGSANFASLPVQFLKDLSIANHLHGFFQGYIQTKDIAFFALSTALFLGVSIIKIDAIRHTGR
ncbi:MAG: ABC transporter permease [Granulosicoccus sp.]